MELRYEGPGHRLEAFGQIVLRGQTATFADAEARSLLAQPAIHITVTTGVIVSPDRPSVHGSRRQWAEYAESLGVEIDDGMGRNEIVAAVDSPEATPDSSPSDDAV